MKFIFENGRIDYNFKIDKNSTGAEIRNFLVDAQNLFGTVNELMDNFSYRYDASKLLEEEIEEILKEEASNKPFKSRKLFIDRNKKVSTFSGIVASLNEAKKETLDNRFMYNRFKSIMDELKSAINVATRILYWDSVDMKNQDS